MCTRFEGSRKPLIPVGDCETHVPDHRVRRFLRRPPPEAGGSRLPPRGPCPVQRVRGVADGYGRAAGAPRRPPADRPGNGLAADLPALRRVRGARGLPGRDRASGATGGDRGLTAMATDLYARLTSVDALRTAWARVRTGGKAPGLDGVTL